MTRSSPPVHSSFAASAAYVTSERRSASTLSEINRTRLSAPRWPPVRAPPSKAPHPEMEDTHAAGKKPTPAPLLRRSGAGIGTGTGPGTAGQGQGRGQEPQDRDRDGDRPTGAVTGEGLWPVAGAGAVHHMADRRAALHGDDFRCRNYRHLSMAHFLRRPPVIIPVNTTSR